MEPIDPHWSFVLELVKRLLVSLGGPVAARIGSSKIALVHVAIHEAGHAVCAIACGLDVTRIDMFETPGCLSGTASIRYGAAAAGEDGSPDSSPPDSPPSTEWLDAFKASYGRRDMRRFAPEWFWHEKDSIRAARWAFVLTWLLSPDGTLGPPGSWREMRVVIRLLREIVEGLVIELWAGVVSVARKVLEAGPARSIDRPEISATSSKVALTSR